MNVRGLVVALFFLAALAPIFAPAVLIVQNVNSTVVNASAVRNASFNFSISGYNESVGVYNATVYLYNESGTNLVAALGNYTPLKGNASAGGHNNVSFNVSQYLEGAYNWTVLVWVNESETDVDYLNTSEYSLVNYSLVIDKTAPTAAALSGYTSQGFRVFPVGLTTYWIVNGSLNFNVTAYDTGSGIASASFRNGTKVNGAAGGWVTGHIYTGSNASGYWNATLNISSTANGSAGNLEGNQTWLVNLTDFAGNTASVDLSNLIAYPLYVDNWPTIQGRVINLANGIALNNSAPQLYNVSAIVSAQTFGGPGSGPGTSVVFNRTFGVNALAEYFLDLNDTNALSIPPTMYGFQVVVNGTNQNVSHMSPVMPPMPLGMMARERGVPISGYNMYVGPAETINITLFNATGWCTTFYGMIVDSVSKLPLKFFDNVSKASSACVGSSFEIFVPANGNYTINVGNPPGSSGFAVPMKQVDITTANLSDSDTTDFNGSRLNLGINSSFQMYNLLGNVVVNNGTLSSPGSNLTASQVNFSFMQAWPFATDGFVPPGQPVATTNSSNVSATNITATTLMGLNASANYSVTVPSGSPYMLVAYAQSGDFYYAGYASTNSSFANNTNLTIILYQLTGRYEIESGGFEGTALNTSKVGFLFVDSNTSTNVSGDLQVETVLNYSGLVIRQQVRSNGQPSVKIPILKGQEIKLRVFNRQYMPMEKTFGTTLIEANKSAWIQVTLRSPEMRRPRSASSDGVDDLGALVSTTRIDFITYNSTCNVPDPINSCFMNNRISDMRKEGDNAKIMDPREMMIGGKVNMLITDTSSNVTTYFVGLDLSGAGMPNMEFDSNRMEKRGGASAGVPQEELRRFGSGAPSNTYEKIFVATPYNSSVNESIKMNISFPYLYDDDGNVLWNSSLNTSAQIPQYYSDFVSWFNASNAGNASNASTMPGNASMLGNITCSDSNSTARCFRNVTSDLVWVQMPHFSTVALALSSTTTGTATTTTTTSTTGSTSPISGGLPGGSSATPTPTPVATVQPTLTPAIIAATAPITPIIAVSKNAVATDSTGATVAITDGNLEISGSGSSMAISLPLALASGSTLASFTDDSSGVTIADNKVTIPLKDVSGTQVAQIIAVTDGIKGLGTTAEAVITSLELKASPVASEGGSVTIAAALNSLPSSASISVTSTTVIAATKTKFDSLAQKAGLEIVEKGPSVVVTKTNLANGAQVGSATVTIEIDQAWVNSVGGTKNVKIFREDLGKTELLETTFVGVNAQNKAVFKAVSPNGLSVFAAYAVKKASSITPSVTASATPLPTVVSGKSGTTAAAAGQDYTTIIAIIVLVILVVAGYSMMKGRK